MERRYRRDDCNHPKSRLRLSTRRLSKKKTFCLRRKKQVEDRQLSASHSSSVISSFNDEEHRNRIEFSTDSFFNDTVLEEIARLEINNENEYIARSTVQNETPDVFSNLVVDTHTSEDEFFFNDAVLKEMKRIEIDDAKKCTQDISRQIEILENPPHIVPENHASEKDNESECSDNSHLKKTEESLNEIPNSVDPSERCIINTLYFINEIKKVFSPDFHQTNKCSSNNMKFIGIRRLGLRQQFRFHCESCNDTFNISSEPEPEHNKYMDINTCAVAGTKSSGTDYSELEEILAYMGIHCMTEKIYHQINHFVHSTNIEIADEEMKRAGAEERKIAEENNCKEGNHLACTVKVDGTWCTRSYRSQGRSKSGATVIVGKNTNKVLFYGVRNKYCQICAQAKNKDVEPRDHPCYKNWSEDQSSCAMESDAAVEGFMRSIEDHQLVYSKVISDKDSSVYLRILQADPYDGIFIQKLDCVTHLLSNVGKELKKVAQMKTGREGTDYKKALLRNICRIRYDIQAAAEYRANEENYTFEEKISNFQNDIKNIPYHVFGQHDNCDKYFCDGKPKENEINIVNEMITVGLFEGITNILDDVSYQAESLLNNENTNIVESINSVICKKIGAKRKNKIQREAYNGAVALATIHINTRRAGSFLNDFLEFVPPTALTDMENRRLQKNKMNVKTLQDDKKKRKYEVICSDDENEQDTKQVSQNVPKKKCYSKEGKKDYGKNCQKPDMKAEEFDNRVCKHYESLQKKLEEHLTTKMQNKDCPANSQQVINTNHQRFMIEKNLLMDRHFGEICRMRSTNYGASMIKRILCPSIRKVILDKYERNGKVSAREVLKKYNLETKECDLFIHKKIPYLAVIPDGITSTVKKDDTVVIIECPYKAKNLTPDEAIGKKIDKINKIFNKDLNGLNENHHLYYRLIGALEITSKSHGLFVLWTKRGIKTICIKRNKEFWTRQMEKQLTSFYEQKVIPEIIDSRTKRNMPMRTNNDIKVIDYESFCNNQKKKIIRNKEPEIAESNENSSNDESGSGWSDEEMNYIGLETLYEGKDNDEIREDNKSSDGNYTRINNNKCQPSDENDNGAGINNDVRSSNWDNKNVSNNNIQSTKTGDNDFSDEFINSLLHIGDIGAANIKILKGTEFLNTDHMDFFGTLMKGVSSGYYAPEYTAKIQIPDRIRPVCPLKSHIQILNNSVPIKHWVCSFYDTEKIYIYDSMNSKELRHEERMFLERLYPHYDFDNNPVIRPEVQYQGNGYSCGEFSIAFAVTLMYGLKPENMAYDSNNMRPHLLQMFLNNQIQHFPRKYPFKNMTLPSLKEAIKTAQDTSIIAHDLNLMNRICLCRQTNESRSNQKHVNTDELETITVD